MSEIKIILNGKECSGLPGQTVLEIAKENNIYIPTLCEDERVAHYGACGLCLIEGEGLPKLMRACSTIPQDGWKLSTETERVKRARKVALELLMSDHEGDCKGPCSLNCPAGTDCQGYVKAIANGDYHGAVEIIKDKFPLPASIGHICPHPCEDACRRQYVEQPISIAYLKRFAGLKDLEKDTWKPAVKDSTGKKVAIIGGGPAGLTAAYHLKVKGHAVTVFDAMPNMGGMLRYGIPAYRLPKNVLEREVEEIASLGVEMKNNVKLGKDFTLEELRKNYDAVLVAVGAWKSASVECNGLDTKGVLGGIDFLRNVILGNETEMGENVVVIGGGNTAMDACRSAVRLGAKNVYIAYRRTRNEMGADDEEIEQAMEEGVEFKFLLKPDEVISENGYVSKIRFQKMELGEEDANGRRRPVPIEGSFEELKVDTVILAVGQNINPEGLEDLSLNERGNVIADELTFQTNLDGVFAVGDLTNRGASIAIAAIGEAAKASDVIDSYLNGEVIPYRKPYVSEVKDLDKIKEKLKDKEIKPRKAHSFRSSEERKHDFDDIVIELDENEVEAEAKRCLECGCHDYKDCKLIDCANCMEIHPERFEGRLHPSFVETKLLSIERNQYKCVLCNLCVRTCDQNVGKGILGLVGRGFETVIKPEFRDDEVLSFCKDCKECAKICPTGALKILD